MTTPGVPVSSGFPLLEHPALDAIRAARLRAGPLLPPPLSTEEKEEALKDAKDATCFFCGAFHAGPNTPACPRIATFRLNGDNAIIEATFFPDGGEETVTEYGKDGEVVSVVVRRTPSWATGRATFVADLAEKEEAGESGDDPA